MRGMFRPEGAEHEKSEAVLLFCDELEALHLCDGEGLRQEDAGRCMGVSRGTVQRLLSTGRKKVATALVHQRSLSVVQR
jgi:uncharacterized protein